MGRITNIYAFINDEELFEATLKRLEAVWEDYCSEWKWFREYCDIKLAQVIRHEMTSNCLHMEFEGMNDLASNEPTVQDEYGNINWSKWLEGFAQEIYSKGTMIVIAWPDDYPGCYAHVTYTTAQGKVKEFEITEERGYDKKLVSCIRRDFPNDNGRMADIVGMIDNFKYAFRSIKIFGRNPEDRRCVDLDKKYEAMNKRKK